MATLIGMFTLFYVIITLFCYSHCQTQGYIGCYSDTETDRDLPFKVGSFSLPNNSRFENCMKFCSDNHYAFYGLQNGAECFCGRSYGKHGPGNNCNIQCRDSPFKIKPDSNETTISCGGVMANAVYGTGINVPGPPLSLEIVDYDNNSISIKWESPDPRDGNISNYQVSAVLDSSFDELAALVTSVIVGANTLSLTIHALKPASLYNITVNASIRQHEFGPGITNQSWTKVGVPEVPPQPEIQSRDNSVMVISLKPATVTNGPITAYQIVVLDKSFITLFDEKTLLNAGNATVQDYPYYITAELSPEQVTPDKKFTVGDSKNYGGFTNLPLKKGGDYSVKLGVISTFRGDTAVSYSSEITQKVVKHQESEPNSLIVPALAGTLAALIFLLILSILLFVLLKRYYGRRRRNLDQELTVQENVLNSNGATNVYYVDDECDINDLYASAKELYWQIPHEHLEVLDKTLGWGKFGQIHDGIAYRRGHQIEVAIHKTKALPLLDEKEKHILVNELESIAKLNQHENVITLIGVCEDTENMYIAIENPSSHNLRDTLRHTRTLDNYPEYARSSNKVSTFTESQILEIAVGVVHGIAHLTQNRIIHKTLACCHILMVDGMTPKITDYGLTHYETEAKPFIPVRWQALETAKHKIYRSSTTVWSFGVVLWEIVTLGATPYIDIKTGDVITRVSRGHRLTQPRNCSDDLYQLMLHCWEIDPEERPNFTEFSVILETMAAEGKEHLFLDLYPGFQYEKYDSTVEYSS